MVDKYRAKMLLACFISILLFYGESANAEIAKPDFNLIKFFKNLSIVRVEKSTSSNQGIALDDIYVGGSRVSRTGRIKNNTWFDYGVQQNILNGKTLRTDVIKGQTQYQGSFKTIKIGNKLVASYIDNGNCVAFASGHKIRIGRHYDNDPGYIDSLVYFAGCGVLNKPVEQVIKSIARLEDSDYAEVLRRENADKNAGKLPSRHSPRPSTSSPSNSSASSAQGGSDDQAPENNNTIKERLQQLDKLLKDGLITKEEAAEKRKEILKDL